MDTGQALYEQINQRIGKLEDKFDPMLQWVITQQTQDEEKKRKVVGIRDFVNLSVSGSIAALVSWFLSKGH